MISIQLSRPVGVFPMSSPAIKRALTRTKKVSLVDVWSTRHQLPGHFRRPDDCRVFRVELSSFLVKAVTTQRAEISRRIVSGTLQAIH